MAIYRKTDTDRQGQKQHASTWSISKPLRDAILSYARNRKTPADKPIFRLTKRTAEAVAVHAELAKIRRTDGALDFHALRHTFITNLIQGGANPRTAQTLARHSTITLTMDRYAHVALADTSKALAALPALPLANSAPNEAAVAATGTHGRDVTQRAGSAARSAHGPTSPNGAGTGPTSALRIAPDGHPKSQRRQQRAGCNPGHPASSLANNASAAKRTAAASEGRRNSRKRRDLCAPGQPVSSAANAEVSSEADGTRTRNHRIDSPVL